MSVSPAQNSAKPSPVPGPSTVMPTPGDPMLNASWTAVVMGWTVDEPVMVIEPVRPVRCSRHGHRGGRRLGESRATGRHGGDEDETRRLPMPVVAWCGSSSGIPPVVAPDAWASAPVRTSCGASSVGGPVNGGFAAVLTDG